MATPEEKQELVDHLKDPRYYRVMLWGYGGESAYIKLTESAYNFWKEATEEEGDTDLVNYLVSAEDGDFDFENIESVPPEANFLSDDEQGEGACSPWYEAPTEFSHQWGVAYDSARLTVEEIDGTEYNSKHVADVIDGVELSDYIDQEQEKTNYEVEMIEMGVAEGTDEQPDYVCQMYSSEKGTFFEGIIETHGDFNPHKFKIFTEEFPNGEDIVTSITYNDVEIDNSGGDTNGKGYSAHLWSNKKES